MNQAVRARDVQFHDDEPAIDDFLEDVKQGLRAQPKRLSPKYFYDQRGSELFDAICQQPEYYPTRTETVILRDNASEIAELIGSDCNFVELGSGVSEKVRILFEALEPSGYLGIDISREFLLLSTRKLSRDYPDLEVHALCADFTKGVSLPGICRSDRTVAFFPGSSIGNFDPSSAMKLLTDIVGMVGTGGRLLIGVDLKKSHETLNRAYNDEAGVTAAFNLNLITRMQQELDAEIDESDFDHRAFYNEGEGRIEMHLVSKRPTRIRIDGESFSFDEDESIHTESSYKYTLDEFADLSRQAGFETERVWVDDDELFSVHCLVVCED